MGLAPGKYNLWSAQYMYVASNYQKLDIAATCISIPVFSLIFALNFL